MRPYRTLKRVYSPLEAPAHYTVSIRCSTSLKRAEPNLDRSEECLTKTCNPCEDVVPRNG